MKERNIILILTALFGLAIAVRAGYEEIFRQREAGPDRPIRSGTAPTEPEWVTSGDCSVRGVRNASNLSSTWSEGPSSVPYVPAAPDEPPAPPPVKPDGDKPPDPAPPAPGGGQQNPAPSPPPAGPEAGKDPNVLILLGGGRLKIKERRLEIDGVLCKREGKVELELLACAPGGKEHESVFILKVPPRELHTALLLMGLESGEDKGGGGPKFQGDITKPVGDRVVIDVTWTKDGKPVTHRAEDLLIDKTTRAPMRQTGWTFTGSKLIDEVDVDTGRPTGRSFYAASRDRSLVTVYHDPVSVLDNPMKNGVSDLVYMPREEVLPEVGTAVTFVFRPATDEELKTFQKNESEGDAAWDALNPPPKEEPADPGPGPGSPHPPDFEGPLPGPQPPAEKSPHPPDFEGPLPGPEPPADDPPPDAPK